jgi:hypothetical protein
MPNLRPFRDYSEHDVINIFGCDSVANKGTLVKPIRSWKDDGSGSDSSKSGPLKLTNNSVGGRFPNTSNFFFELNGVVTPTVNWNDTPKPIGILLKDVKEYDENGELLVFNTRKAEMMDVIIKNYNAAPILTRGLILINDIDISNRTGGGGNPDIGDTAYVGSGGKIGTDGIIAIGTFLSPKDENGYCLVKISIS